MYDAIVAASRDEKFSEIMHDLSEKLPAATNDYSLQMMKALCKEVQLQIHLLEEHKTYFDYQSKSNFRGENQMGFILFNFGTTTMDLFGFVLTGSVESIAPYVPQMTGEMQREFLDFMEEYIKKSNEVNNSKDPYKAEYEVVFLIARKPNC